MARIYPKEWQAVSDEVTKEVKLEFKQDPSITASLEEGGQAGKPYRLGFDIVATRALHLSMSFDHLRVGFTKRWSYATLLTYYAKLRQAVANQVELGDESWCMIARDPLLLEKLAAKGNLFRLCSSFANGAYEAHNKKISIARKRFEIVPHESGSMIIANTLPTAEGGLLKVGEFISLADSIEQALN